ncbi:hypothetical protein J1N35_011849 [Gossypium stocksii]|uniref:Uncharacterized protein n=1 Tax=Gossypium stocksii TaxID=47602 RepID=A0A9D3W3G4_9ROSI|nr:hypothetical protein J1N35_011849 [Gossypium stocksii]
MGPKKRPRIGASSSHQPSRPRSSFNECFRTNALHERLDKNFASKRVWESRKVDIGMLEGINFFYLSILQNWGWMDFLNISSLTYYNLFRTFFSNAKLEHDESGDTVIAITYFLMNTSIRLTLEEFGDYLHVSSKGNSKEKGPFNPAIFIQFGSASKLNLHDHVLHLIITWNLRPIKKHAKLRNTNNWWLDSFHTNRHPDLALIMFNDITKAIERGMNTNITLPHGTYFSYLFRRLGINTHGNTLVTFN